MKKIILFITAIGIFFIGSIAWAEDTVVTIYFAGTGLTEEWWNPALAEGSCGTSGFWTRESVATLHKWQNVSGTQKKKFIDGIGSGCPNFCLIDLIQQGVPDLEWCRGWETCLEEAKNFLVNDVLPNSSGKIILNLVGFSRGGISAIRFANRISSDDLISQHPSLTRIEKINLLAFDPVAGDTGLSPGEFILDDLVSQYVGIYSTDERAALFSPAIPDFESSETKYWMFRVPGSHETMAGNIQTDGHSTNWNPGCGVLFLEECFDEDLLDVSWVTTFISVRLLGSSQWGNVDFNMNELNAWHGGLSGANSETLFVQKVGPQTGNMWDYNYWGMRKFTVFPLVGFESCEYDPPTLIYRYYAFLDWFVFGGFNYDRCTDWFYQLGSDPAVWQRQTLESGPFWPIDPLDDGEWALAKLQELGNSAPVADANGPYVDDEGSLIIFDASGSSDPDGDPLTYRWDFDNDGVWDTGWSSNSTASHTWGDNHTVTARVEVSDGSLSDDADGDVTVHNVNPTAHIDSVEQPHPHFILPLVHTLTFHGSFTDPGWLDTHTSMWNFGDGSVIPGTLIEENTEPDATGNSIADHSYAAPGDYPVILNIKDDDGGMESDTITVTVVTAKKANEVINNYIQMLPETAFKNNAKKRKNAFSNKMSVTGKMIDSGKYQAVIDKLLNDVRAKADGYVDGKSKNDWITDPDTQEEICMMIDDLTAYLESL